jgi:hypothetical protein
LFHASRRIDQDHSRKRSFLSREKTDLLFGAVLEKRELILLDPRNMIARGIGDGRIHDDNRRVDSNDVIVALGSDRK